MTGPDAPLPERFSPICDQLHQLGVRAEWVSVAQLETGDRVLPAARQALLRGEVDAVVLPLSVLPAQPFEDLAIAALSARQDPSEWLVVHPSTVVSGALFGLGEGAVVAAGSRAGMAQMRNFRPDLTLVEAVADPAACLAELRQGKYAGVLLPAASLTGLTEVLSDLEIIRFSPRELVPPPGQGVMAWLVCAADKALRRSLRAVHHSEVSSITNVERKVLRLLGEDPRAALGVYGERDEQGNLHFWAALAAREEGPLQRARLSQSTSYQLAERILAALERA